MKKTTFLLIGAALVVIAVMALVSASCQGDTPAPPASLPTTVVEPPAAPPEHTREDTSGLRQQYLPDTGGVPPGNLAKLPL